MLYDAFHEFVLLDRSNNHDSLRFSPPDAVESPADCTHNLGILAESKSAPELREIQVTTQTKPLNVTSPVFKDLDLETLSEPITKDDSDDVEESQESFQNVFSEFLTTIRSHGIPLDTITERSSIGTLSSSGATTNSHLPSSASSSLGIISQNHVKGSQSYPGCQIVGQYDRRKLRVQRATKSVDDKLPESYQAPEKLSTIPEDSQSAPDDGCDGQTASIYPPENECLDPLVTVHSSSNCISCSIPKPPDRVKRPTSTYVRDIYHKLIRLGGSHVNESVGRRTSSPSKIPIPSRFLSPKGDKDKYQLDEHIFEPPTKDNSFAPKHFVGNEIEPKVPNDTHSFSFGFFDSKSSKWDFPSNPFYPLTDEDPFASDTQSHHNVFTPTDQNIPIFNYLYSSQTNRSKSPILPSSGTTVAQTVRVVLPSPPSAASSPLVIPQNRSIFDIRAAERRLESNQSKSFDISGTSGIPPLLRCRNSSEMNATPSRLSSTQSSRETPWDQFPQPPSPNLFVTPPPFVISRENEARYSRMTSNQDSDCQTFYSIPAWDAPPNDQATSDENQLKIPAAYKIGTEATNLGNNFPNDNDGPETATVTDSEDGQNSSPMSIYPNRTIHMPSPLRPRSRPHSKYVLFPDSSIVSQSPAVRRLRSLSSQVRAPSLISRSSKRHEPQSTAVEDLALGVETSSVGDIHAPPRKSLRESLRKIVFCGHEQKHEENSGQTRRGISFFTNALNRIGWSKSSKGNTQEKLTEDDPQNLRGQIPTSTNDVPYLRRSPGYIDAQVQSATSHTSISNKEAATTKKQRTGKEKSRCFRQTKPDKASGSDRMPKIFRACFCQAADEPTDRDAQRCMDEAPRKIAGLNQAATRSVIE